MDWDPGVGELTHDGRHGGVGGVQGEARGGARRQAQEKALTVLFDLGLGQRVEIGENVGFSLITS